MPGALSKDLRQRVVDAYDNGEGSYAELAERFQIGIATVKRWMWRRRDTGDVGALFSNNPPTPATPAKNRKRPEGRFSFSTISGANTRN